MRPTAPVEERVEEDRRSSLWNDSTIGPNRRHAVEPGDRRACDHAISVSVARSKNSPWDLDE